MKLIMEDGIRNSCGYDNDKISTHKTHPHWHDIQIGFVFRNYKGVENFNLFGIRITIPKN